MLCAFGVCASILVAMCSTISENQQAVDVYFGLEGQADKPNTDASKKYETSKNPEETTPKSLERKKTERKILDAANRASSEEPVTAPSSKAVSSGLRLPKATKSNLLLTAAAGFYVGGGVLAAPGVLLFINGQRYVNAPGSVRIDSEPWMIASIQGGILSGILASILLGAAAVSSLLE